MTTPDKPKGKFTSWIDERIKLVADTTLSSENISRLADALKPTLEQMIRDLKPEIKEFIRAAIDSVMAEVAEHIIGSISTEVHEVGVEIQSGVAHLADVNAQIVDNFTDIIPGTLDDQLFDGLANRLRDILRPR